MCGRFALTLSCLELLDYFELDQPFELEPHWNITPGRRIATVRLDADGRRAGHALKWGLVPFWAKDEKVGYKMTNARSETAASKPAFREAFRRRRCLIPASGFYEWDPASRPKQPYYISLKSGEPMAFAGLWESWKQPETGEVLETCCILTTAANALVLDQVRHDRMPVLLPKRDWSTWLSPDTSEPAALEPLMKPFAADLMQIWSVSTRVNKPAVDEPSLIEPHAGSGQPPGTAGSPRNTLPKRIPESGDS